jgi:pyruvate kinase
VRTVQTLDAIIREAERTRGPGVSLPADAGAPEDHAQAICEAAVTLANRGDAQAIVAVTRGGGTARRLAALRPRAPIFAATDRREMARRLSLYWGVSPGSLEIGENVDQAGSLIAAQRAARPGERRVGGGPRQHQPGSGAQRRQLPEDPADLRWRRC